MLEWLRLYFTLLLRGGDGISGGASPFSIPVINGLIFYRLWGYLLSSSFLSILISLMASSTAVPAFPAYPSAP